jgi:nucleoside-diphosphate-sugar epimerase
MRSLVTGGGGFIGGHLVKALLERGDEVRAVDRKDISEWHQVHEDAENYQDFNITELRKAEWAVRRCDVIYHLAAEAGGMGYISTHMADCTLSILCDTAIIRAARETGARTYLASSACVYPLSLQQKADSPDLAEDMAYPAEPEEAYGLEKLFAERMYLSFAQDYGVPVRIGRFQSVFGPHGVWRGGREKAPTAICRKVALAKLKGEDTIEVWGDGSAIRTFTYVDDAVAGTIAVTDSDYGLPLNVGSDEVLSISELVSVVGEIAGHPVRSVQSEGPVGVPGRRGCDTTLVREKAGWHAKVSVREGLERTYSWVYDQLKAEGSA